MPKIKHQCKASRGNAFFGGKRVEEIAFPGLKFNLIWAAIGGKRVFRQYASGKKTRLNLHTNIRLYAICGTRVFQRKATGGKRSLRLKYLFPGERACRKSRFSAGMNHLSFRKSLCVVQRSVGPRGVENASCGVGEKRETLFPA